mmetsp:Transcript_46301/g.144833  ORF Transcript_46301/g.144833 Transcript_46301/m.144833 type:complete len:542 (-) Transcript_46301:506-2131(-)
MLMEYRWSLRPIFSAMAIPAASSRSFSSMKRHLSDGLLHSPAAKLLPHSALRPLFPRSSQFRVTLSLRAEPSELPYSSRSSAEVPKVGPASLPDKSRLFRMVLRRRAQKMSLRPSLPSPLDSRFSSFQATKPLRSAWPTTVPPADPMLLWPIEILIVMVFCMFARMRSPASGPRLQLSARSVRTWHLRSTMPFSMTVRMDSASSCPAWSLRALPQRSRYVMEEFCASAWKSRVPWSPSMWASRSSRRSMWMPSALMNSASWFAPRSPTWFWLRLKCCRNFAPLRASVNAAHGSGFMLQPVRYTRSAKRRMSTASWIAAMSETRMPVRSMCSSAALPAMPVAIWFISRMGMFVFARSRRQSVRFASKAPLSSMPMPSTEPPRCELLPRFTLSRRSTECRDPFSVSVRARILSTLGPRSLLRIERCVSVAFSRSAMNSVCAPLEPKAFWLRSSDARSLLPRRPAPKSFADLGPSWLFARLRCCSGMACPRASAKSLPPPGPSSLPLRSRHVKFLLCLSPPAKPSPVSSASALLARSSVFRCLL